MDEITEETLAIVTEILAVSKYYQRKMDHKLKTFS
jgi:hypothetical protein